MLPAFGVGSLVADTYEIKQRLGEGGMGTVYLARHRSWNLDVALKVPRSELLADPEFRARTTIEAEAWTDLGMHPHIAYCSYVEPLGEALLLVVEYVDGGNLRDWIAAGRAAELRAGLDLAIQFCHGLEHAHARGLIHRDVKPENVLLTRDGTLKLTDFGIVRADGLAGDPAGAGVASGGLEASQRSARALTRVGLGTPDYMAPEQWLDGHAVDVRADIFSFGVCLYEMLCGSRPYAIAAGARQEAPDPATVRGDGVLPPRLCDLLQRCVAWGCEERPANMNLVRDELCAIYEQAFGEASRYAELPAVSLEADGWNNRALSYLHLGKQAEAERAWEAALAADPQHLEATYNRGVVLWRQGRLTDAALVRHLERVRSGQEANWVAPYLLAQVHLERGDLEAAKRILADAAPAADAAEAREALRKVRVEGFATGRCVRTFEGHEKGVNSLCPIREGRFVLSGSSDETLRLWEVATGRCVRTFDGHHAGVTSVCLSGDGRFVLSGSRDETLQLREIATGSWVRSFEGHENWVTSVCPSGDGRFAISGSRDETLRLWEILTGRCVRTFEGHRGGVTSVRLSGDCRFAISGSDDQTVRLWEISTGRCVRTFEGHRGGVTSVCLRRDGRFALSGSSDKTLRLWELPNPIAPQCWLRRSRPSIYAQVLERGSRFRELLRSAELALDKRDWVAALSLAREARAAPGYQRSAKSREIWAKLSLIGRPILLRGLHLERVLSGHSDSVWSVCLSGDGRFALSGSWDTTLRLWEISTSRCVRTFEGHEKEVNSVWPSGDGRFALSGSRDKTLRLWEVATGRCVRTFEGHENWVNSVFLSEDSCFGLSGSVDKTLRLWEISTGRCVRIFEGHSGGVTSVCLSGDGRFALSGSKDKTLRLWEISTGRWVRTFEGHENWVNSVCLSGDGCFAISGSDDQTVRLWEISTGRCMGTFEGHTGSVQSASLTMDRRWVLSGGSDGTLRLRELDWELEALDPADWDEGARPYLETFLTLHTPYASDDPMTPEGLSRRGRPSWNHDDFQGLVRDLQYAGYGWLRPEGVGAQLENMAADWQGPPPLSGEPSSATT